VHALEQIGQQVASPKFGSEIHHRPAAAKRARAERRRQRELENLLR
jgi:hypothetical protein